MVGELTIENTLRQIEKYFLRQLDFELAGRSCDFILLTPSESGFENPQYSWLLSDRRFDHYSQLIIIRELLEIFRENLSEEEYLSIARINIINSQSPLVRNIRSMFPLNKEFIEITDVVVAGEKINYAILINSKRLQLLKAGRAVTITRNDGIEINAGIISMDHTYQIKYWTGKGLRELFNTSASSEEIIIADSNKSKDDAFLSEQNYIAYINYDEILSIS
ncbi:MAG: hypothetical protein IPO83_12405 [Chitinophagaceae bacterium]|nr:hypothetical protein [Chitinophagaceae bacterium]